MGLVGGLVLREPQVPVDAVGAVLRREGTDRVIETPDAGKQLSGESLDRRLGRKITVLVSVEPLLVVVQGQILQESQRLSHFTGIVLITLAGLPTSMAVLSTG